jgi:hypothetical protein
VDERRPPQFRDPRDRQADSFPRGRCKLGDPIRVPVVQRRLEIDRLAECAAHAIEAGIGHPHIRLGLGPYRSLDRVRSVQHREDPAALAHQDLGERGVECRARTPADRRDGSRRTRGAVKERRGRRHLGDAGRLGDHLPGDPARTACAVPLLVDVAQAGSDTLAQAEPVGCASRDLAVGEAVALHDVAGADGGRAGDAHARQEARRRGKMRKIAAHDVARIAEVRARRGALDGDLVATEQGRRFVRIGRAADVLQERRVIDVPGRRGIDHVSDLHRHHRRAARLPRLEAHTEIRDERQTSQQLRDAQGIHCRDRSPVLTTAQTDRGSRRT